MDKETARNIICVRPSSSLMPCLSFTFFILLPSVLPSGLVLLYFYLSAVLSNPHSSFHMSLIIFLLMLFHCHSSHHLTHTTPLLQSTPPSSTPMLLVYVPLSCSASLFFSLPFLHSCCLATLEGCSLSDLGHTDREPPYSGD